MRRSGGDAGVLAGLLSTLSPSSTSPPPPPSTTLIFYSAAESRAVYGGIRWWWWGGIRLAAEGMARRCGMVVVAPLTGPSGGQSKCAIQRELLCLPAAVNNGITRPTPPPPPLHHDTPQIASQRLTIARDRLLLSVHASRSETSSFGLGRLASLWLV
jgi:hypothetical protein